MPRIRKGAMREHRPTQTFNCQGILLALLSVSNLGTPCQGELT